MDLDKILKDKINEVDIPGNIQLNIDELTREKKQKKLFKLKTYVRLAASLIIILVVSVMITKIGISNEEIKNANASNGDEDDYSNNTIYTSDKVELSVRESRYLAMADSINKPDVYIDLVINTYENEKDATADARLEVQNFVDLLLVKVEGKPISTNYDAVYDDRHGYNGEKEYTSVRTISNLKVEKVLGTSCYGIKEGDTLEFRNKGGNIPYSDFIKSYNGDIGIDAGVIVELNKEYQKLCEMGYNNIYVNYKRKDYVSLEEGKTYLVYVIKKSYGQYWSLENINSIMIYNEGDNTVYNNISKEYEPLDGIRG